MAFNPANFNLGAGRVQAAESIAKALRRWEDDKRKTEFNQGMFETLSTQTKANGEPLVTPELLQKWHSMNPDAQAGALSLMAGTLQQEQKKELTQMHIDAADRTSPFSGQKVYDDAGNDVGVYDDRGTVHLYRQQRMTQDTEGDLDAEGNPVLSADGTMYRSGGKFKPVTPAMITSRLTKNFGKTPAPKTVPSTTPPAPASSAPVITSEQDYAAVPDGGLYMDARDGKLKRKKAAQ